MELENDGNSKKESPGNPGPDSMGREMPPTIEGSNLMHMCIYGDFPNIIEHNLIVHEVWGWCPTKVTYMLFSGEPAVKLQGCYPNGVHIQKHRRNCGNSGSEIDSKLPLTVPKASKLR